METNKNPKVSVGFICYNNLTAKYLPVFLPSLIKQDYNNFEILVLDNSEDEVNKNSEYINVNFPEINFEWSKKNQGFAVAYNQLIEKAIKNRSKYFLTVNPDTILMPNVLKNLVSIIEKDKSLGSVCPKILSWDFQSDKRTNLIDTCGIIMNGALRFRDCCQGEIDNSCYGNNFIIGPSGAGGLFRLSALQKIKDQYGYYDSRMFMYKEDCDLAYRLNLAGYKTRLADSAVIYHDRTAKSKGDSFLQVALNRKNKKENIRRWSLANQQLIFKKHWHKQNFFQKISIIFYELTVLAYLMIFERNLLKTFFNSFK
jgi:GT2 family glycosyltransferase